MGKALLLLLSPIWGTLLFFVAFGITRVLYWRNRRRALALRRGEEVIAYLASIGVKAAWAELGIPEAKMCASQLPGGRCEGAISVEGTSVEHVVIVSALLWRVWRPDFAVYYLTTGPDGTKHVLPQQSFQEAEDSARLLKTFGAGTDVRRLSVDSLPAGKHRGPLSNEWQSFLARLKWTVREHGILSVASAFFILALFGFAALGFAGIVPLEMVERVLAAISGFFDRVEPFLERAALPALALVLLPWAVIVGVIVYLVVRGTVGDWIVRQIRRK